MRISQSLHSVTQLTYVTYQHQTSHYSTSQLTATLSAINHVHKLHSTSQFLPLWFCLSFCLTAAVLSKLQLLAGKAVVHPSSSTRSAGTPLCCISSVALFLPSGPNQIAPLDACPQSVSMSEAWGPQSVPMSEAWGCVQDKLLSMAVANHVLWPLAKFVNAKLVPKQHQPVANKVVQVSHAASPTTTNNNESNNK